jgi:HEAT repeat protein
MINLHPVHAVVLGFILASSACASGERASAAAASEGQGVTEQSTDAQSAATTLQSFKTVEGADLAARLENASRLGKTGQTPYWSAYAFDVRAGIAVDPGLREFHGSMNTIGDTVVFTGKNSAGLTVETRNLAVFLLREPGGNQVTRMEIYNLERKREYSGYPVYWMGRANNNESLDYLQGLSEVAPLSLLSERAVLGISLHDDARVGGLLKNFIRTSKNSRVRSSAIYWLGQVGGEQQFLAELVRNEGEDKKFRRQAAHAIGASPDRGALATLQGLYETIKEPEIRRAIIHAAGDTQEREAAFAFLLKVARTDPERDGRRAAIHQMGDFDRPNLVEELMKIYASEPDLDVKRVVLHALSETRSPGAQAQVLHLARTEPNPEMRKRAIRVLGERGEAAIGDLLSLYDAERVPDLKRTALQSLGEIKSTRVEDKLFEVARQDESLDLRRQAIRLLGERASRRSLDFLSATAQSADGNTEVQVQAVRAISERKAEEAVPLLIKIAKTHPQQLVRKQAMRALGESGDPRAVEYFREVLTK